LFARLNLKNYADVLGDAGGEGALDNMAHCSFYIVAIKQLANQLRE
jgi:hypothetical protein